MKLLLGNNIDLIKQLEDNSIDSVVTDPPYGLKFMGKKWDYEVPSIQFWKEVYRILKPGGHILSFGGTRTYHRMVVNIEDAGFEIRDQIQWIYGSGFPKSLNIGKAVDKIQGNEREIIGKDPNHRKNKYESYTELKLQNSYKENNILDKGTSPYEGWGTALKPANEPICLARKPISENTIAENVLKWGTGGVNIDGCRIQTNDELKVVDSNGGEMIGRFGNGKGLGPHISIPSELGRFPANIIFDEESAELLDDQSGVSKSGINKIEKGSGGIWNKGSNLPIGPEYGDQGGASRFFYCAKVSKSERNKGLDQVEGKEVVRQGLAGENNNPVHKNNHPTVKPIKLMSYICRLITPKNGVVLDPFMGSGSTGISAKLEGFDFIGMEMNEEYFKIAEARIKNWKYE